MTTMTHMVEVKRHPMVVRWVLVTDAHGRTRPEMRWEPSQQTTGRERLDGNVTLAA